VTVRANIQISMISQLTEEDGRVGVLGLDDSLMNDYGKLYWVYELLDGSLYYILKAGCLLVLLRLARMGL
jgi:hypothetical protein